VSSTKGKKVFGFLKYTRLLIRHRNKFNLTDSESMLILSVMDYSSNQKWGIEHPYPSNKTVADKMDCSERKIQMLTAKLKSKGFLERKEGGRRARWDFTNLYNQLDKFDDDTTKDNVSLSTSETTHKDSLTMQNDKPTTQDKSETMQFNAETSHVSSPKVSIEVNREEIKKEESISNKDFDNSSFINSTIPSIYSDPTYPRDTNIDPELIKSAREYKDGKLRKEILYMYNKSSYYNCLDMRRRLYCFRIRHMISLHIFVDEI